MNVHQFAERIEETPQLNIAPRPDGLDDEEWALVRTHRIERAYEERCNAAWRPMFADLESEADDHLYWGRSAQLFVNRAQAFGWDDEALEDFAIAFIEAAAGFEPKEIRNHGTVLARRR